MLLDTSGLLCLHDADERHHANAIDVYHQARVRIIHSYVLAEFMALAHARRFPRVPALEFMIDLMNNEDIKTVWVDEPLHREAAHLLRARLDKTYSLCDAVSFVLMRKHQIQDALTTDGHFDQEGFHRHLV